ncbi:MAG: four helix bundle protein [Gemmatimonadota bacterium]
MHPFRKLSVWRKAHELALATYRLTDGVSHIRFPGVASQLRRAAASIPANVAEGAGRDTAEQFCRFLELAVASAREVDYFLLLAADLGAIGKSDHAKLEARTDEVCRMLVALRTTIRRRTMQRNASRAELRGRKSKERAVSATKSR